jgi:3-deoxy-D-manno-octulosonate 8-phosphate phosphatase (KDO 8-P phosphatase)
MIDSTLAQGIKLLILDVDGVLTDNSVIIGLVDGQRIELKSFNIQDGLGLGIFRQSGIPVVWMSGRISDATTLRATELRINEVLQLKGADKLPATLELMKKHGVEWKEIAFVGDDLADLPVMRRCGLPIAVANAVAEVKECAAYVTRTEGGKGAVREVIELLLRSQGTWDLSVSGYLRDRGDDAA